MPGTNKSRSRHKQWDTVLKQSNQLLQKSSNQNRSWKRVLGRLGRTYMESSSVHCLRYLIHPECPPLHRFGWGLVFVLTVMGAVISITGSYFSFVESPVVMTVDTSSYHMSNIPFPAVTVCNINKMKRSKVLQLARVISECSEMSMQEVFHMVGTMGNMFDNHYNRKTDTRWMHKLLMDAGREDQVRTMLEELAPTCEEMLRACTWMGNSVPCSSYFTPLLTVENGFCCVFNFNMSFENLLPEYFNDTEEITSDPPIVHQMTLGITQGLSVYLDLGVDEYYFTSLPTYAAKVIVSSAQSFQDSLNGDTLETLVPLGTEVYMRLEADSTFADKDVMEWPFEKRKCHFHHEKKDHFKGFYTFASCLVSCRVRNITKSCGCLPIFMPKKNDSGTALPHCNLSDLPCLAKTKRIWSSDPVGNSRVNQCDCWPACNQDRYSLRTWQSQLTTANFRPAPAHINLTSNSAVFHLFSGITHTTRFRNDILIRDSQLYSNLAGLLSLFLGCSCMSVFELIYFLFIRPVAEKFFLKSNDANMEREADEYHLYWTEMTTKKSKAPQIKTRPYVLY